MKIEQAYIRIDEVGYLTYTPDMSTIDRLIAVADGYIVQPGSKPTTTDLHAFGGTMKHAALPADRNIQVRSADADLQGLAINSPVKQPLPAILLEWRKTNPHRNLQRPSALSEIVSDAPDGDGRA